MNDEPNPPYISTLRAVDAWPEPHREVLSRIMDDLTRANRSETLVALFRERRQHYVQCLALTIIDGLPEEAQIALWRSMLLHQHWCVRARAAEALNTRLHAVKPLWSLVIDALTDPIAAVRCAATKTIGVFDPYRASHSLMLRLHDRNTFVRIAAVEALAPIQDTHVRNAVLERLDDPDWFVRTSTMESLVTANAQDAVPHIIARLTDRAEPSRRIAAECLGKLGDSHAIAPLIARVPRERQATACAAMVEALGHLGDQRVVPLLLRTFQRTRFRSGFDANVRRSVLIALGNLAVIEPIIRALQHDDWLTRANAASILGHIQAYEAQEALHEALNDSYIEFNTYPVRDAAAQALAKLKESGATHGPVAR